MPLCTKIGPESHCFGGKKKNSNLYKDRPRIPMFRRMGSEFQRLQWKSKLRIAMIIRIATAFRCFE